MGKKVDSNCVRVHLKEGDGAICTSGAKMSEWRYSEDPKFVTCPNCLRGHILGLLGRMAEQAAVTEQNKVHFLTGDKNVLCCDSGQGTDYIERVTCPKCLLAWGKGIAKQLAVENTRANRAEEALFKSDHRAEDADKAWKLAQNDIMKAWGVANTRLEEIVAITAREQNVRDALRAVMKLV